MAATIEKRRTATKQPSRKQAARKQPSRKLDTGHHDRRLARRLKEDPEFRAEFERQQRAIEAIDALVNKLDTLRAEHGMTKADLARAIDKSAPSIRRLLTVSGNPELRTVVAMADALDADVEIVPRKKTRKTASK